VARERAAGQGARLVRGEEHKHFDAGVRLRQEVKKNDLKTQKEETGNHRGKICWSCEATCG
jgi:hypothetical protein